MTEKYAHSCTIQGTREMRQAQAEASATGHSPRAGHTNMQQRLKAPAYSAVSATHSADTGVVFDYCCAVVSRFGRATSHRSVGASYAHRHSGPFDLFRMGLEFIRVWRVWRTSTSPRRSRTLDFRVNVSGSARGLEWRLMSAILPSSGDKELHIWHSSFRI